METLRLRKLQEPSQVTRLLELCVTRSQWVPEGAYQIRDPTGLPEVLRGVLAQTIEKGQVWACWEEGVHLWVFTAEMSLGLSRERGAPVLQVNSYGEDGVLKETGHWTADRDGKWGRCEA